ncbi:hypothetical protein Tco_0682810 [Tanacetum coccineum]|uniref:Uncharacterized protein n=1 Tax=Tanacetum coccineum TaxID=301880 RepID=A0ABQ4XTT3_9ASTR
MDDPDITMEEYIWLKTEKALRKGKLHDALTSELELLCEPTVSPQYIDKVNWKIKISLSDSDDENYTVIYDNYSFSYKIFNANDSKLDMGNGDEKIDIKQSSGDGFSTWMTFGGNTRDLGSCGQETDEITDLHQIPEELFLTARGDSIACIKRCRRDPSGDSVRDLMKASGHGRLNKDLESSM